MSEEWIKDHDALNEVFRSGRILTASRRELERHLLTTCEVRIDAEKNQDRNKRRADTIRHLLQVRITERLALQTRIISILALIVSVVAVVFAGLKYFDGHDGQPAASAQSPTPTGVSP